MPILQASIKDVRKTKRRTAKNSKERQLLEGLVRRSRQAIAGKTADAAALVKQTAKALDKAVAHGLMKRNTVARLKSRLMKKRTE